jgi:hypothetical protein
LKQDAAFGSLFFGFYAFKKTRKRRSGLHNKNLNGVSGKENFVCASLKTLYFFRFFEQKTVRQHKKSL